MTKRKEDNDRVKEPPVTYEVYADMPDDGNRYEILDGVLEMMSPGPSTVHQGVSGHYVIGNLFEEGDTVQSDKLPCVSFSFSELFQDPGVRKLLS